VPAIGLGYGNRMARTPRISGAITDLMAGNERHAWTLEEMHADLARSGTATDFSSVFRAAEKLVAGGAIRKVLLDDGRARFELVTAHHDHLHCTRCDELVPVPCVIPRRAFAALEARTGIAITEHRVVLSGLCRLCRKTTRRRKSPA
jgi:Fur family ferric uptake transcriptional regulator